MPKSDREVFEYLTSDPDTPPQSDFIAYALFAHAKREWIILYEENHDGASPTQTAIDEWISNITDYQFENMRKDGDEFFVAASEAYFGRRLDDEKSKILTSEVVREVKAAGSFRNQLSIAMITSILVPLIFGSIIALTYLYEKGMLTAGSVAQGISHAVEQSQPAKTAPPHSP